MGYTVGVAAMLLAFYLTPASVSWLQWATVFMIGFFLYGPQMLIGLCGAELVGPESVGASEGFLGWVAYLGAANAGIPLSMIVKVCAWLAAGEPVSMLPACGGRAVGTGRLVAWPRPPMCSLELISMERQVDQQSRQVCRVEAGRPPRH